MNNVTVLGATGSIGTSTLDVIRRNRDKYALFAATAHKNVDKMLGIIREFNPRAVVMTDKTAYDELVQKLAQENLKGTEVLFGRDEMSAVVQSAENDSVMSAIVGAAGLKPTLDAITCSKTIYLANKESLVMSGRIFVEAAKRYKARILPVDSEHNAIFQCLPEKGQQRIGYCDLKEAGISKILLTGSGGPFRERELSTFTDITPSEAVNHPNWSMGRKISVDSATMMNKGLEFIEAKWLFNAKPEQIQVVIHPESVIHSMVQYVDGSVLAQLGKPDMRTPIARAMAWPERISSGVEALDFFSLGSLTFRSPDFARYPCLRLAMDACATSQGATTAVNAANEIAVAAFLNGEIKFTDIYNVCARVTEHFAKADDSDLNSILHIDMEARARAFAELGKL